MRDMRKSQSALDVESIAPAAPAAAPFLHLSPLQSPRQGSAINLLEGATSRACQEHENDHAEVVIVCEPEGTSLMMGGLHPRASLYERPVNLDAAKAAHSEFRYHSRDKALSLG